MAKATKRIGNGRYCWPRTLRRPSDLRIVYLDLNHWIDLAKAYSGHKDGRKHREILDDSYRASKPAKRSTRYRSPSTSRC